MTKMTPAGVLKMYFHTPQNPVTMADLKALREALSTEDYVKFAQDTVKVMNAEGKSIELDLSSIAQLPKEKAEPKPASAVIEDLSKQATEKAATE